MPSLSTVDESMTLDFTVRQGEFLLEIHEHFESSAVAVVGPSGAGKTTVLDAIAGLRRPETGRIRVRGRTLFDADHGIDLSPPERRVGYVPQDVALFPHLNVRSNILYGTGRGVAPPIERVLALLEIEQLTGRRVAGLSGGERQRVALARAVMSGPELLLLDEPLAAVDTALRERILPYIERVRDELGTPVLYVSHSADEVRRIADCVVVLESGRVQRVESADRDGGSD